VVLKLKFEALIIIMKCKKHLSTIQTWAWVQRSFHLSEAHIQMAKELGMNPKKLGKIANHKQEPWKMPLSDFIEQLHEKKFLKRSEI